MRQKAMIRAALFVAAPGLCLVQGRSLAEVGQRHHPVTNEMVLVAMQQRELPTDGVQLRISAPIMSLSANPMLDVQSVSLTGANSAQIRVACRSRADCGAFYVAADWPANSSHPGLSEAQAAPVERSGRPETARVAEATAAPGRMALLVIEDEKVHIQLRVVYLQAGLVGETVRVSTPDRKQSFKAQIVTATLVKGSF